MSQDFKCAFGLHRRELLEQHEVTNIRGDKEAIIYVTKCKNCGKIHSKRIEYGLNR